MVVMLAVVVGLMASLKLMMMLVMGQHADAPRSCAGHRMIIVLSRIGITLTRKHNGLRGGHVSSHGSPFPGIVGAPTTIVGLCRFPS